MTTDIVILDTETLGLDPDAPIWEFAAIRRFAGGGEDRTEFQIQHNPGKWLDDLPEQFRADYSARYNAQDAATTSDAAIMMNILTRDAVVVGCNPSFDLERIAKLLRHCGMQPAWHYRPVCVTVMAAGWLHGVAAREIDAATEWGETPDPALVNRKLPVPWSSDELSRAIGIDPDNYQRHTAMGDCLWVRAQWDTILGGTL